MSGFPLQVLSLGLTMAYGFWGESIPLVRKAISHHITDSQRFLPADAKCSRHNVLNFVGWRPDQLLDGAESNVLAPSF